MRALAVLAVVLFHLSPHEIPGGYLGVDVFFVISGYLIIGNIARDLRANQFSFIDFYSKRVKRLFPAFFVTIVFTSIGVYKFFLPEELTTYSKSLISSLLYFSNFFFYTQSNYFGPDLELSPLLHTWSLSVEEQFYLFFPLLMVLFYSRKKNKIIPTFGLILTLSFILSIYLGFFNPSFGFYASPARFWQFVLGGIIVFIPKFGELRNELINSIALMASCVLIGCFFKFHSHLNYQALYATIPSLATGILLYTGRYDVMNTKMISNKIFVFLGKISYSLYLWHWPIIVFFKIEYRWGNTDSLISSEVLFLFSLSLIVSYLSWRFVEDKFQHWQTQPRSYRPILTSFFTTLVFCFIAYASIDGLPRRYNEKQIHYASYLNYSNNPTDVTESKTCFLISKKNSIHLFDKINCINLNEERTNVLLIGDSHADHWALALKSYLIKTHAISQVTASGCKPVFDITNSSYCQELMDWALTDLVAKEHFDLVIFSARWKSYDIESLKKTINQIKQNAGEIMILGPIVEYNYPLPWLLAFDSENRFRKYQTIKSIDDSFRSEFEKHEVKYVSVFTEICKDRLNCKTVTTNDIPLQHDYGHLTNEGALEILERINNKHLLF